MVTEFQPQLWDVIHVYLIATVTRRLQSGISDIGWGVFFQLAWPRSTYLNNNQRLIIFILHLHFSRTRQSYLTLRSPSWRKLMKPSIKSKLLLRGWNFRPFRIFRQFWSDPIHIFLHFTSIFFKHFHKKAICIINL